MLPTSAVVFCAIDPLIPSRGRIQPGFEDFTAALQHAGIPLVWVSGRTRFELDDARRKLGHGHPFIPEGGSGVYLPEDYFHLRLPKSLRLGRFTCIPVAQPQPAASEALDQLSEDTGVPVVKLKSLSPRELTQNLGLPGREAELARHRDFDEPFFFVGSSDGDIQRFREAAQQGTFQLRQQAALWSLAVGANLKQCVRELSKLYERALRTHPIVLGIAMQQDAPDLFPACDRTVLLTEDAESEPSQSRGTRASRQMPLSAPDTWERILEGITQRR